MFRKHSFHKHLLPDMHGRGMPSARRTRIQQTATKPSRRGEQEPSQEEPWIERPLQQHHSPDLSTEAAHSHHEPQNGPATAPSRLKGS